LESNAEFVGTNAVYNNVFRHLEISGGFGGVLLWPEPSASTTDYIFNNLIYDVGSMEYFNVGQNSQGNQGRLNVFNNTFETTTAQAQLGCATTGFAHPSTFANNHYINDAASQYGTGCTTSGQITFVNDSLKQTHAQANANAKSPHFDPYTTSQAFAFSPVASTNSTVGAGTNEQSFCTTMLASSDPLIQVAGAACQSDTTYACSYYAQNHTVSCPSRNNVARPASAWDIGAYQFSSAQAGGPNPPTGLTASVQ
jgi:hypothetical protein